MHSQPLFAVAFLFLTVVLPGFSSQTLAQTDRVCVGAVDVRGNNVLEQYDSKGEKLATIPISEDYAYSRFLADTWLPNLAPSVAAITIDEKERASLAILNDTGAAVVSLSLGKAIRRVLALDYDGSGLADLAVQGSGKKVTVYLNPGLHGSNAPRRSIKVPGSIIAVPASTRDLIGTLKLSPATSSKKRAQKGLVKYTDENGKKQRVRLRGAADDVFALKTAGGIPVFALVTKTRVTLAGASTALKGYSKKSDEQVLSGNFSAAAGGTLLFGGPTGSVALLNPSQPETDTSFQIPITSSSTLSRARVARSSSACTSLLRLQSSFLAALAKGSILDAMRIAQSIAQYELLCAGGVDLDDGEDLASIFSPGKVSYISVNNLQIGSTAGPCDKFNDSEDGLGGFLAKNSDSYKGSVYLTEYGYTNGRLLNSSTYKVIEKLEYTGIANGGRNHFRSGTGLPRAAHIFAADYYGETHCWQIPGGRTRVD